MCVLSKLSTMLLLKSRHAIKVAACQVQQKLKVTIPVVHTIGKNTDTSVQHVTKATMSMTTPTLKKSVNL